MDKKLVFEINLEWTDLRDFYFYSFYKRPMGIFLTVIGTLMWGVIILYLMGFYKIINHFPSAQLILASSITIFLPLSFIYLAKKNFTSRNRITEKLIYKINIETIEIKGETFETKLNWEKIHKVKETKNWFLIYTSKNIANILPKRTIDKDSIIHLKSLLKRVPNLKLKLIK